MTNRDVSNTNQVLPAEFESDQKTTNGAFKERQMSPRIQKVMPNIHKLRKSRTAIFPEIVTDKQKDRLTPNDYMIQQPLSEDMIKGIEEGKFSSNLDQSNLFGYMRLR